MSRFWFTLVVGIVAAAVGGVIAGAVIIFFTPEITALKERIDPLPAGARVVTGALIAFVACAYVVLRRTPRGRGRKRTWRYSRARPWALAGLVVIPVLVGVWFVGSSHKQTQDAKKVSVLVANFGGPNQRNYSVTPIVLARLHETLDKCDDVQVHSLGREITEADGSTTARKEGERRKSAIVIWGWYGVTEGAVLLTVHFELLRPPKDMPDLGAEANGRMQTMAKPEIESFALQIRLSEQMSYLTLLTAGVIRYAASDWEGAIALFNKALSCATTDADRCIVFRRRAVAYCDNDEYALAILDLNQAIHLDPQSAEAYSDRGWVRFCKKDCARAVSDLDRALQLNPDLAEAYSNRGMVHFCTGNYERAVADLNQALRINHGFAGVYTILGLMHTSKGEYDNAIADLNSAIRLDRNDPEAYCNRGVVYVLTGDYDRAVADFGQAIRLDPKYALAYCNRGTSYAYKGGYRRAIADSSRAVELNPRLTEAYGLRAIAYACRSDYERALVDCNRIMRSQPNCVAKALLYRGYVYYRQRDYGRAIADFDCAIAGLVPKSSDPDISYTVVHGHVLHVDRRWDVASAYYGRGCAYHSKGDYDRAIADFSEGIRFAPGLLELYNNRGWTWYRKGDYHRAISDLNQAIRIGPSFRLAYGNRMCAHFRIGRYGSAVSDLVRFLILWLVQLPLWSKLVVLGIAAYMLRRIAKARRSRSAWQAGVLRGYSRANRLGPLGRRHEDSRVLRP